MTGKVAIVTGASNGIGLATCEALLSAGWSVLGVDVAGAPSISHTQFKFLQADLCPANAPKEIVSLCLQTFGGRIDALLNVAGVTDHFASAATFTDDVWERVMAINLTAPVRLMREVIPIMKAQKSGSIVNVSSKAGMAGASAGLAYTVSKHGLIGATKNTAWLFKDDGIRCNAICPAGVRTNIFNDLDWEKIDQDVVSKIMPVNALSGVSEISTAEKGMMAPDVPADLLVFLASELSRGINGAIIPCDNAFSVV